MIPFAHRLMIFVQVMSVFDRNNGAVSQGTPDRPGDAATDVRAARLDPRSTLFMPFMEVASTSGSIASAIIACIAASLLRVMDCCRDFRPTTRNGSSCSLVLRVWWPVGRVRIVNEPPETLVV